MVLLMQIVDEKSRNLGDDIASLLLTSTVRDDDGNEVRSRTSRSRTACSSSPSPGTRPPPSSSPTASSRSTGTPTSAPSWSPIRRSSRTRSRRCCAGIPPSHYQGRWVEQDVTLHGVTIPADSRVILITGAANHDERAFADPEYFDIHRDIERHVGLGFGIHLCVGAALARLETRIAFEELLARYPNYELRQPMQRAYSSNVRGLSNLPLALDPAA